MLTGMYRMLVATFSLQTWSENP